MINHSLKFINRDTRDQSKESITLKRYHRIKGKSLKTILMDRFINNYGYDKGIVTAHAIVNDILALIEQYYRYTDNSFLKPGQMVWHAVPINEYPQRAKPISQTRRKPVVLDIISEKDIEHLKKPLHHREIRLKKAECWTHQAYDQEALLTQLDLAVLFGVNENTVREYIKEYYSLYQKPLPTRGNIQDLSGGQTHKKDIITMYLKGYLVPTICQRTNYSKEAVERYIRDFEAIRLLDPKFEDIQTISLITRLSKSVVQQYINLIPPDN